MPRSNRRGRTGLRFCANFLSCGIAVLQNKRLAVFRNFRVISMRFSYVILCGVYTYFCAVLRYSYPPPNRRRDAAHNLVAYFARAKPKLKEREKFGSEVPLKFLLETRRIVFLISCLSFCSELSGKLISICQLELLRSTKRRF